MAGGKRERGTSSLIEYGTANACSVVDHKNGILAMKSFLERSWKSPEERQASPYPKSWCKPINVEDKAFGMAAMRYALSLGVDTFVPPGNFPGLRFAV